MSPTVQQQMLIEQRITNEAPSPVVAYLLLIFLGWFGAHRFYLGKSGSAITILILSVLGWITLVLAVGLIPLIIVGIWLVADIFMIPSMIRDCQERLRQRYSLGVPLGL